MVVSKRWFEFSGGTNRSQKLNTNFFFSNFSGTSGISRQNPGISRQKHLISLVSRDISNFLAPTPSRGRPPPHRKISGLKSLGLGSFFLPERNSATPFSQRAQRSKKFEISSEIENFERATAALLFVGKSRRRD